MGEKQRICRYILNQGQHSDYFPNCEMVEIPSLPPLQPPQKMLESNDFVEPDKEQRKITYSETKERLNLRGETSHACLTGQKSDISEKN